MKTGELGPRTACRCTKYSGALRTLSSQESKQQLAGDDRHTLSTSATFANKLLAVLHFPLGESVLVDLGAFLALSHLVLLIAL